ncbi:pyocin knob domain-containing protein [Bacillus pumilus]|uniref:pyocin knob domain-containing protein n=1 Tax=Bacillus pumilus TaxID=1408 RepID=UPI003F423C6A
MAFTKEIPQWENAGQKPPQSKITEGFKPLDHPPADWFNWFFNGAYEALKELQDGAASSEEVKAALKVLSDALLTHSNAKNNPHAVTKSQIGLGNVDNIKQASKADFDSHVADKILHTSEAEKNKWNNGQLFRLTQNNGKPIYKGTSETTDYNEITDTGFYLIYNKGLNGPPAVNRSFMIVISYGSTLLQTAYDTNGKNSFYRVHNQDSTWADWTHVLTEEDKIPQSEKDKWNNSQLHKLTPDDGKVARLANETDIFTLPTGFYMGANLVNTPISNDGSFYYIEVLETAYSQNGINYKRIIVTRSFDNMTWIGTFHAQGFREWKRLITDGDAAVTWKTPSLSKGWKQYVSSDGFPHTLRYSKDASGVVEIIGSITGGVIGHDVEAFTLLEGFFPLQSMHFIGVASSLGTPGVPQYHRTYIGTDGRVCVQSCSNTVNPNEFITFGVRFKAK